MNRIVANIRMELLSDTIFSSGNSIPGGADITLRKDSQGRIYVPGSTIKGLLREAMGNYMVWTNSGTNEDLNALLGHPGIHPADSDRRLIFGDLRPENPELAEEDCAYLRTFTKLKNGVAEHKTLHSALCIQRGLILTGKLICAEADAPLVKNSLLLIQSVGLKRNRGFGQVRITFQELEPVQLRATVPAGNWIHYRLLLHTPLAISAGASAPTDADRKNYTDGKNYVPGSAIRGLVMSYLAKADSDWFHTNKQALLQQVFFRNALPMINGVSLIPTPLGFYEDREQTQFYHVLSQEVVPGHKRARLGSYCCLDGNRILHGSPTMESLLRITASDPETRLPLAGTERQMFSTEALAAGTVLEGHVYVPDPALTPRIAQAFQNWLSIGADRFGGSGLCSVELLDGQAPDSAALGYRATDPIPTTLWMLIVSPTALMNNGEVSELTDADLTALLGVPTARIERCATSIQQNSGFNRTWGCALPTVSMYAPGTVLRIACSEAPSRERLLDLEQKGIGIRRNEGCGQVLFLRDLSQVCRQASILNAVNKDRTDSQMMLRRRARYRWLMENRIKGRLSDSQQGDLQQLCEKVLHGSSSMRNLTQFFRNKRNQTTGSADDFAIVQQQMDSILSTPLYQTLGCEPFEDTQLDRLALFCELFDMNRKEGSR